jgi:hypothetical protein
MGLLSYFHHVSTNGSSENILSLARFLRSLVLAWLVFNLCSLFTAGRFNHPNSAHCVPVTRTLLYPLGGQRPTSVSVLGVGPNGFTTFRLDTSGGPSKYPLQ